MRINAVVIAIKVRIDILIHKYVHVCDIQICHHIYFTITFQFDIILQLFPIKQTILDAV